VVRGILLDIGERKQFEQRLALAGVVFDKTREGIMITDATNRIIAVNPAFETITGYAMAEVVGKDPKLLNAGLQAAGHFQSMWQALQRDGHWSGEVWNRRKSGEPFAQRLTITVLRDPAGQVQRYLAMFSDVTTEKRQAEEIKHQAAHDALTGLPNRRLLSDRMEQAVARAQRNGRRVGIVMLDLDGFKHINDTLGHRVGDLLLIEAARRLAHCVRESDTVARVGGDEFMVVLPEIQSQGDLQLLATKILAHIREPYAIEGKELFVSCSIGLTLFPDDGANPEDLLAHADTAMYRAKSDGKNTYRFFTAEMHEHAVARLRVEDELRHALHAGEFELHYQVAIDLATQHPAKAEALVRWRHPQRGLLDPVDFIPVAEETGLILQLGAWVIDESARQAARWGDLAPSGFCIGANVSAQQFHRSDCVTTLRETLAKHAVSPQRISIEITESLFIGDQGDAWRQLNEIRDLGVRIAIDDFGTGYSSLSYLKRFPVDTLKIDQTFVRGLPENTENAALVEAIISMGRALGLAVVAEGVETAEQRDFLAARGCRYGQGYLFGRAMSADEFAAHYFRRDA
jgi:diguanylate cyclase (GGDEF)-like protein/PAS domain S-box-containing protein